MIRHAILHVPYIAVVIIERARVSLPCTAVVDNDEFPTRSLDRRAADRLNDRAGEIAGGSRGSASSE